MRPVVTRVAGEAREVLGETSRQLGRRDLSAAAASTTYYAAIAVVPWLLLALWTSTWTAGADAAQRRLLHLGALVPPAMGARTAYDDLVAAGAHLGLTGALLVVLPASFYGEGLRRGALALAPHHELLTGWRARLVLMPLAVLLPLLAWVLLTVGDLLVPLSPDGGGGGLGDRLLRIVVGFTGAWLVFSVVLTWVFREVMPGSPRWRTCVLGGLATGSFVAGMLHGFQLFLSIPIDLGTPFGGLGFVGGMVAVGLWLYVLHVVVLVGWCLTTTLERRAVAAEAAS